MKINHEFNVNLTVAWVFLNRTIQQQSKSLRQAGGEISYEPIVQFKKSDSDKSLIFLHPAIGGAECYKNLSGFIDVPVNTYAVESYNLYGTDTPCDSIPLLGKRYADIIMYTIPSLSSCTLGGWSLGGLLSFEVARVLRHRGITIDEIILIDTLYHDSEERALQTSFKPVYEYIHKHDPFYQSLPPQYHKRLMSVGMAESDALAKYEPETYTGSVVLLKAMKGMNPVTLPKNALGQQFLEFHKTLYKKPDNGWKQFAKDLIIYEFNADHQTIMYDTSIAKEMGKVVASLLK